MITAIWKCSTMQSFFISKIFVRTTIRFKSKSRLLQSQEILKYLKKHGGDSKKKDSEGRSCKKIAKDNKAVWNLELIQ